MADRVYPSTKPNPPPPTMNGAASNGTAAANGAAGVAVKPKPPGQLYNPNRPRAPGAGPYRPNPRRSKSSSCSCRRFCCLCFIYTLIVILCLLLVAAIAASVFYVLYHPKHPTFSVLSVRISAFNLSTPADVSSGAAFSHLNSKLDFTIAAKNPNKKISFLYDQFAVAADSSGGIEVGNATLPAFTHVPSNTTIVRGTVVGDPSRDLDSDSVSSLKSDLNKKNGFPLSVQIDTQVEVKMGKLSSKKVGIRVLCDGIRGFQPKLKSSGKKKTTTTTTPAIATISNAKCKLGLK
ncbi:hypothetical protein V2J09_008014 [Rumex salicifolius]